MNRKEQLLHEAFEVKRTLVQFLRHPLTEIKHTPDWHWKRVIALQVIIAAVTGVLAALVEQRPPFAVIFSLILSPILTLVTLGISTLFFYYCFQIFAEKTVSLRKLFTLILFANIPQFIFQIISGYVPPITLVGMAFTALLLLVGFVENFQLDRKLVIKLISVLYALFFVLWMWNKATTTSRFDRSWNSDRIEAPEVELGK